VACQKHGSFSVQAMMDVLRTPLQVALLVDALQKCVALRAGSQTRPAG
jgi:hypothetical protein